MKENLNSTFPKRFSRASDNHAVIGRIHNESDNI